MMRREQLMLKQRRILVQRRAALWKTLVAQQDLIGTKEDSVGDRIDGAVDCEQDEVSSQLAAVESRELAAIDAALERIRDGLYGLCDDCDKPIPVVRLQALPYATRCLKCQREEERFSGAPITESSFDAEQEFAFAN
jgi:DnaK suppressor protein